MALTPLTPPARLVDPRGQRFGAGVSVGLLSLAFVADAPLLVALVAALLAASSAFGTRFFLLSRPWPAIRRVLALGPAEPEHEYPPRFAQALGTTFLVLGLVTLALLGRPWGWVPVAAVVGLQSLLATTGYCVGCRLYFLRWWLPSRFARIASRGDARVTTVRLSMGPR